jgi:ubiquinone/menaquinone biosynthesis C-methylase UbiE
MNNEDKITRCMPSEVISWEELQYHLSRYVFAASFVKDKVVLDVASGIGYGTRYLKSKNAKMIIGGDISEPDIKYATKCYKQDGIEFMLLNATELPFAADSFDIIVSMETIEHVKEYEKYLNECKRVLKNGGLFICSTPNREIISPGLKKPLHYHPHVKEFSISEFKSILERYYQNVEMYGIGVQSKKRVIMRRLKLKVESLIINKWIINFINSTTTSALRLFPSFHRERVDSLETLDYETGLDQRYKPYPIESVTNNQNYITISVSKVRK